ncbi:SAC3/GANP/Nin1/mts3/eIF-3 p25 family-domain-containing protein [Emericellopsis atlantica]|uniref:SAC3/GANP/Nin1/mts3/eIF-3 p25 family-domain-containing protein n=1 Tax=Emericellopsis atlantica TaxID=2614577 RepID=A0A9P7ZNH3_9HYPO|nr:SAC3/GANP/Nin1/mts3/eIF-3 p25 family-domain-containing protein [Emericellopsis atlantica]KAG9255369.1 SAC3/GANP/Nin1/mts3/eIF-3 p25 family-domain-containing protein [Emericellopsis atlantica]
MATFNPFAANNTTKPSTTNNPFAPATTVNPFAPATSNHVPNGPFSRGATPNGDVSDSGLASSQGKDKQNGTASIQNNVTNGSGSASPQVARPFAAGKALGTQKQPKPSAPEVDSSSEDTDGQPSQTQEIPNTTDPYARRVYEQLRKDNIRPPKWPSKQYHTLYNKKMEHFRNQYEAYRQKVRESLIKAGLLDDPNKRRALKDAIDFRGIAEDMCPEWEKITRIFEGDVVKSEKNEVSDIPETSKMVKKIARSAAGQDAPLPMDVRSIPALQRTLDYLVGDLLDDEDNLANVHGFLWDRTRAIRRDYTFFSRLEPEEIKSQVAVFENIARFHVTSLHLLSRKDVDAEGFVEHQETEQLARTLLSLRDLYDDCNQQGIECPNEAEFRAYYLLFHGRDPDVIETLQRSWRPELWKNSEEIQIAVSLVEALQNTQDFQGPIVKTIPNSTDPALAPAPAASASYLTYFRILEDPSVSFTMACFAECHFPVLRRSIVNSLVRALARPKVTSKDLTAAGLNKFLRFDTAAEAVDFVDLAGLQVEVDDSIIEDVSDGSNQRLLLEHRQELDWPSKLPHQSSEKLVGRKRGSKTLVEVIRETVYESGQSATTATPSPAPTQMARPAVTKTLSPPSHQAPPVPNALSSNSVSDNASPGLQTSPFGVHSTQAPQTAHNPFAAAASTSKDAPKFPFGSGAQSTSVSAPQLGGASSPASVLNQPAAAPSTFDGMSSAGKATDQKAPTPGLFSEPTNKPAEAPTQNMDSPKPSPFSMSKPQQPEAIPKSGSPQTSNPFAGLKPAPVFSFGQPPNPTGTPASTASTTPPGSPKRDSSHGQSSDKGQAAANEPLPATQASQNAPAAAAVASQSNPFKQPAARTTTQLGALAPQSERTPQAPTTPKEIMDAFSRWFVLGDTGIMDQFTEYIIGEIVGEAYNQWMTEETERIRKEEEDAINAEVEAFKIRNLRIKYFYRWKKNARAKRMATLRRQQREELRRYKEQQAEERKEAERQQRREERKAKLAKADRASEMAEIALRGRMKRKSNAEQALLDTGVLSGVTDEHRSAKRIARGEHVVEDGSRPASRASSLASSTASTSSRYKGKARQLYERFAGKAKEGFYSSMPSFRSTVSPKPNKSISNASERWKLKAMGIVQMPDGTALPERMADAVFSGQTPYPTARQRASSHSTLDRRSLHGAMSPPPRPQRNTSLSRSIGAGSPPTTNKRKRNGEDDEVEITDDGDSAGSENPHKRVLSESEQVINDLRAMRKELDEDTAWLRTERIRWESESRSRASTPWGAERHGESGI